jgi:hypothetical protein
MRNSWNIILKREKVLRGTLRERGGSAAMGMLL